MTHSGVPGRISTARVQRNALIGQTESSERQAQALERIADALEFLCAHMYPTPAPISAEDIMSPAEVDYESGKAS